MAGKAGIGVEGSPDWRTCQIRGFWRNSEAARTGPVKVEFTFLPSACVTGDIEAWIDDVVVTPVPSMAQLDYAGFRYPEADDPIPSGAVVPTQLAFDQRVSADSCLVGMGDDPGMGDEQRWLRFEWYRNGAWEVIPKSRFPYLSDPNYTKARIFTWQRPDATYAGRSKVRVAYFAQSNPGPNDQPAALIESPWFIFLPHPPQMQAESPAVTGLSFEDLSPYGLLNLDYDSDLRTDILACIPKAAGAELPRTRLFRNDPTASPHRAKFLDGTTTVFGTLDVPLRARTAAAGIVEDGELLTVAICTPDTGQSTQLYTLNAGGHVEALPSHQIPAAVASYVWAAAFADMDQDGDLDVYLARAGGFTPTGYGPSPADIAGQGVADALLAWNGTTFQDVTTSKLPPSGRGPSETIAAAWTNVDGDVYPDLFVAHLGAPDDDASPGWSPLYINHGTGAFTDAASPGVPNPLDINFTELTPVSGVGNPSSSALFPRIGYVSGAEWVDVDRDNDRDLVIARRHPGPPVPECNVAVLLNTGHGRLVDRAGNGLAWTGQVQGITVADLDGNEVPDIVCAPATSSDAQVAVFMGTDAGSGSTYEALYAPAVVSPFDNGTAGSVIAGDYDKDDDIDVLLARPYTANGVGEPRYYYSNPGNPGRQLITVHLEGGGSGNNELGIGGTIKVEYQQDGELVTKAVYVDGGGRAQADAAAGGVFAADPDSGTTATVRVIWPDGFPQEVSGVAPGDSVFVTDSHFPLLNGASVEGSYTPYDGYTVWTFEWDTTYSCSRHEIGIQKYTGGTACNLPPSFLLTPETEGASLTTIWDPTTTKFHHVLTWTHECFSPCTYRYIVRSYSSTRVSTSGQKTLSIPACGYIEG